MRGHTLVELLFVLTLMGATTASLAPTARQYRDRSSVVAAREALIGVLAEARLASMESGEAIVRITADPAVVEAAVRDSTIRRVALGSDYNVVLSLNRGRSAVDLRFDALGLGRLAGQTIGIERGEASTNLIVSSYGRVRRR